jgi:hypothetical protein
MVSPRIQNAQRTQGVPASTPKTANGCRAPCCARQVLRFARVGQAPVQDLDETCDGLRGHAIGIAGSTPNLIGRWYEGTAQAGQEIEAACYVQQE